MNKGLIWLVGICLGLSSLFTACKDDVPTADPNSDWAVRNKAFLDSIAGVCNNPPSGEEWEKFLSFKLSNEDGGITAPTWNTNDYVYVKYLPYLEGKGEQEQPEKGIKPLYTDSVDAHYRGMFYNGEVFDQSFSGEWNENIHEPVRFVVRTSDASNGGVIAGWTTALMNLKEKTHVMLYIPYNQAYGEFGNSNIPGYSTLVFDLRVDKVIHPKGPDDRKLKKKQMK